VPQNLAGVFLQEVRARYRGTTAGRQSWMACCCGGCGEGALWTSEMIEAGRVRMCPC